jgi:hypothetical protein
LMRPHSALGQLAPDPSGNCINRKPASPLTFAHGWCTRRGQSVRLSSSSSGSLCRHYRRLRLRAFHLSDCPIFRGHLSPDLANN